MKLDTEIISETPLSARDVTTDSAYRVLDDLDRRISMDPVDPYGREEEEVLAWVAEALNAVIGLFDGR